MPILLLRVDERLIHGQVVVGWGNKLDPQRYIVVDDDLTGSDWERDLYQLSVPEGIETVFCTVVEARERLREWLADPTKSVLLTRDIETMSRLAKGGALRGCTVNLGGLHHGPGRDPVLSYLHLSVEDRRHLRFLEEEGVIVSAQDLPGSHRVELAALLDRE